MTRPPLPIDPHLPAIAAAVRERGAAVVVAPPGAGKTTRVPPALLADGPLILLQPRRVAARAIARRIAAEEGVTLGEEVGWQVRFERRFSPRTRLLVATEGVLTARLQADPLLSGFRTVVLDEFHERSLHADLALALGRQAARARGDLRLVVMSATLEAGPIADYLGGCPVIELPGRLHPVEVTYRPGISPEAAVGECLARDGSAGGGGGGGGHVLCFLPGAAEIERVRRALEGGGGAAARDVLVLPLHGSLDADAQDRAVAPAERRKVVLATNLAETSLTVDGVTDVVDAGWEKVLRFDAARGIDRLELERISQASADQRAGRAGRTGPGRVLRLWEPTQRLRPRREPDVARIDLAGPVLEVLAWGDDPRVFPWFEPPPPERIDAALTLLARLGAVEGDRRLTKIGEQLHRFPLHPRLARVLVAAGGGRRAAAACALLAERDFFRGEPPAAESDVLLRLDRLASAPEGIRRAAAELAALAARLLPETTTGGADDDERLLRALLAGYPDRVARRREPGSRRLLLAAGTGALLGRESGVVNPEWLLALEVVGGGTGPEAIVRLASGIDRAWLAPTGREVVHRFDAEAGRVRAVAIDRYDALVLGEERPVAPDPEQAAAILAGEARARGLGEANDRLLRRLRVAGVTAVDPEELLRRALAGATTLRDIDLAPHLPADARRELERHAPEAIEVPSGRRLRLEYREDGSVVLAVKIQELFGLAESPRVGRAREPVVLALLAPNGRPVQMTRDLRSFWERGYPEVRKELRGRYPKHPWPEDPWTAPPTARAKRRG